MTHGALPPSSTSPFLSGIAAAVTVFFTCSTQRRFGVFSYLDAVSIQSMIPVHSCSALSTALRRGTSSSSGIQITVLSAAKSQRYLVSLTLSASPHETMPRHCGETVIRRKFKSCISQLIGVLETKTHVAGNVRARRKNVVHEPRMPCSPLTFSPSVWPVRLSPTHERGPLS